jgi:hypothetical protein
MDPTYKGFSVPTPTKVRSGGLNLRKPLLIGGGVLLVFVIVGLIANLMTPNTTTLTQRLLYRLDALNTLANSARPNISSDSLAKINADLLIVTTGDYASLTKVIPTVKSTKELTAIKTEEADAATTESLKTAKVNGQYDNTYKAVLMQKIESASALANELQGKTSKTSVKSALTTLKEHLNTYYTQLQALQ